MKHNYRNCWCVAEDDADPDNLIPWERIKGTASGKAAGGP